MKEISELNLPEDVRYAEDHEWARQDGDKVRVGISDYAQDQLGDVVFVELPQAGDKFSKGDAFGSVESVKAVSELFMPIGGEISAINNKLEDEPELVNSQPYGDGWMIEVKVDNASELDPLMDKNAYLEMLKGL
jgi:glycine cleavage system H protein